MSNKDFTLIYTPKMQFDTPVSLPEALSQWISNNPESSNISLLRSIKNAFLKKPSAKKRVMIDTKYNKYYINSFSEYSKTLKRNSSSYKIYSDGYPIFAMKKIYVSSFTEDDVEAIIDEYNNQMAIKHDCAFKYKQQKEPKLIYRAGFGCNNGRKHCALCRKKPNKGLEKAYYDNTKFFDTCDYDFEQYY